LQQTGFVDIDITAETADFIYADDEEWWLSLWSNGSRRRLEVLEAPELAQVKTEMLHRVQALKRGGWNSHPLASFGRLCSKTRSVIR